jgi:broad specificity phosphatase PhoE
MTTQILLVRHGQTAWNREERVRGRSDVPLDETGRWQAQVTARYVAARWPLAAIYASPMGRAMDTAQAIADAQGLTVQPHPGLLDLHFGEWEGLALTEVKARYPDMLHAWFTAPQSVRFPGGEGLDEVRQRSSAALAELAARHEGTTIGLVAHTVVNRVLLCAVLGLGNDHFWHLGQDTCAVNLIEWDGQRYTLALLNDTSHMWRAKQES